MKVIEDHAIEPRHCLPGDVFTAKGEGADALISECAEYLSQFAAPVKDEEGRAACFHCGGHLDSFSQIFGSGVAYRWAMVHGEANCSGCGWPARGMHYPKGADGKELFTARNLFLAYHPDVVEART